MDPWSFIAPSSGNIISSINGEDFSDDYFKTDHESVRKSEVEGHQPETKSAPQVKIKEEIMSPPAQREVVYEVAGETPPRPVEIKQEKVTPVNEEEEEFKRKQRRRRSMSVCAVMEEINTVSHLTDISHGIQKIHLSKLNESNHKHKKNPDLSTKSMKSMSSASSQISLVTHTTKFVSMAEAIYHLQKDTPERFHTYSKSKETRTMCNAAKNFQTKFPCIPQSPALLSKTRNRNVKILSQKEIEDMEYEEVKKFKIKANPVPKAVMFGTSNFPLVERRAPTKPVPFNLTQIRKKPPAPEKKFVFSAKPAPKHILEKNVELPKKTVHVTVPKSPNFASRIRSRSLENMNQPEPHKQSNHARKYRNPLQVSMDSGLPDQGGVGHSGVPLAHKTVTHPCKPKPFSFEQRDKEMMRKKEEKIQMVFEEEKKMREFHANPIPGVLKKSKGYSPKSKLFEKKVEYKKENKENESDEHKVFKARPPVVLFKSPFKPQRKERPVLEPCQIQLTTEVRALKRNVFNQQLKEKEEQLEQLKKIQEEERLRQEEEEKAAIRAQLVHKAAPVRHYQPVVIHPSELPLTRPESPKFHLGKS